jgi:hypothetical protein
MSHAVAKMFGSAYPASFAAGENLVNQAITRPDTKSYWRRLRRKSSFPLIPPHGFLECNLGVLYPLINAYEAIDIDPGDIRNALQSVSSSTPTAPR